MSELIIKGVPHSIARDAMWMTDDASTTAAAKPPRPLIGTSDAAPIIPVMLAVLIFLADLLFWKHPVGLSLILFSAAVSVAAIISLRPRLSYREWVILGALWIACALPVFELLQFVSGFILITGHLGILTWCATRSSARGIIRNVLQMPYLMAKFMGVRIAETYSGLGRADRFQIKRETAFEWLLPLGVGAVFILLFLGANPIFERWADNLSQFELNPDSLMRLVFWVSIALLVLPFVLFKIFAKQLATAPLLGKEWYKLGGALVNARSITNSLLAFNVMFLLQNGTDLAVLWGGADLPEGMTYATYAHRGAYPLMLTSILAGVFALVSRQYVNSSQLLKGLLLLWVFQNVFLVGSALARLDLYVEAYGLTYLRLRAGIGMGLVFVGMGLLLWQVWRGKSNVWLTTVFASLFAATLYVGCFVNFGYVIARHNLTQENRQLDTYYLCDYTLRGIKAISAHATTTSETHCVYQYKLHSFAPQGWRDWGFRNSRLASAQQQYLAHLAEENATQLRDRTAPTQYDYDRGEHSDEARHSDR